MFTLCILFTTLAKTLEYVWRDIKTNTRPKNSTAPGPRPPFWNSWIRHCRVPVVVLCTDLGDVDCRIKLIGSDPQNGWQALVLLQASFLFWGAFVRRRKYWAGFYLVEWADTWCWSMSSGDFLYVTCHLEFFRRGWHFLTLSPTL